MPILTYLKLGAMAAVIAAGAYLYFDYQGLKRETKEQAAALAVSTERVRSAETQLVETIAEHNAAVGRLRDQFYAEREQRKLSEINYASANTKIVDLLAAAQDEKAKYESGRLARLSAAKPGLLTRMARRASSRRNSEWQAMVQ